MDVQIVIAPTIPHFKGLGMKNLQNEIRICKKDHNKVTMTMLSIFQTRDFKNQVDLDRGKG